jgi:hypothetical protein
MTSAELRWFWRGRCPQPVYDWFFRSGLPPGGGFSRIDRYVPQRGEPEISLKRRGDKPDFEIKGLVTKRSSLELEPLAPHIEIWCKWPCTIPGAKIDDLAVTKTRWLRKFDTSKYVRSEIPLGANEKPTPGYQSHADCPARKASLTPHCGVRRVPELPSMASGEANGVEVSLCPSAGLSVSRAPRGSIEMQVKANYWYSRAAHMRRSTKA